MKKISELDNQCEKIYSLLAVNLQPLTFNKLFEKLQTEMTKPTLIKHLEHLQSQKIVKREKIGKQKVTYTIHNDFIHELDKEKEFMERMFELDKGKETFNNFSMAHKIENLMLLMTLAQIDQLRNSLESILEPNEKYKTNLRFALTRSSLYLMIKYLFLNNVKSETDAKEALKELDKIEKKFWAIALDNVKAEGSSTQD